MDANIALAHDAAAILRCYPVMRELRTHVVNSEEFVERVTRQQSSGYHLVYVKARAEVRAVAGYQLCESLYVGRFLYVDDLVTQESDHSAGYGGFLFDWLVGQAREHNCERLELDSGVQRFEADRFYPEKTDGYLVASLHAKTVKQPK